jgi:hypothetical protein
MRFDQAAISLEPRSTSNCLDLAVCFLRQYLAPIAGLWATVAVPSCVLVYLLIDRYEFKLPLAILVLFVATSPLGVLLVSGAAPAAFGEPFTFRGTWARLGRRGVGLLARGLALRVAIAAGAMLFFFPGWYLLVRTGFFVEQAVLSKMARHLHDRRADELLKGEIGDLFLRSWGIFLFCTLLWLVMLLTADFLSSHLLGLPLLMGRLGLDFSYLEQAGDAIGYSARFLWGDPIVVTAALAAALLVYPIGRLAWFFCYVDVRVRRDCWDVELQILQEGERLQPVESS